jgi:hypothetical protein
MTDGIRGGAGAARRNTTMKLFAAMLIVISIVTAWPASEARAEYDSRKLGNALGQYLAAIDILERLSKSKCSYIVRRNFRVKEAVKEAQKYLNDKDIREFERWLHSSQFKSKMAKNQTFIDGFLRVSIQDGIDEKTACGMLVTTVSTLYKKAEKQWNSAKFHYSK